MSVVATIQHSRVPSTQIYDSAAQSTVTSPPQPNGATPPLGPKPLNQIHPTPGHTPIGVRTANGVPPSVLNHTRNLLKHPPDRKPVAIRTNRRAPEPPARTNGNATAAVAQREEAQAEKVKAEKRVAEEARTSERLEEMQRDRSLADRLETHRRRMDAAQAFTDRMREAKEEETKRDQRIDVEA